MEAIIFRKGEGVLILDRASSNLDNDEVLNELKYTNQKNFLYFFWNNETFTASSCIRK